MFGELLVRMALTSRPSLSVSRRLKEALSPVHRVAVGETATSLSPRTPLRSSQLRAGEEEKKGLKETPGLRQVIPSAAATDPQPLEKYSSEGLSGMGSSIVLRLFPKLGKGRRQSRKVLRRGRFVEAETAYRFFKDSAPAEPLVFFGDDSPG